MSKKGIYQYYVEGEDEKKIINVLKQEFRCIESGKVEKFNAVQNKFTTARIRPLKMGTTVILVYDTDIDSNIDILKYNIDFLEKQSCIRNVICIPQVKNLEDELLRACQIRNIKELTNSRSQKDYKADLISCNNLYDRLKKCDFSMENFWTKLPKNGFARFGNNAEKIIIA